jgi:hypothetical protein
MWSIPLARMLERWSRWFEETGEGGFRSHSEWLGKVEQVV